MAENQTAVELVRSLLAPFEQGDVIPLWRDDAVFAAMREATGDLLSTDFECVFVREDVGRSVYRGIGGLRAAWLDWLEPWERYSAGVEDVVDAGGGRVVVLTRDRACPKGTTAEIDFLGAPIWTVRDGKVARIEFYFDRAEGLAAAGIGD
jgi:ketosteroid isomerase-like protein